MKNALRIVAVVLGLSLIIGESIRSFGQDRPIVFVIDDFIFGGLLIAGAWAFGVDTPRTRALFAAAWGVGFGGLYGSFFGKLFPAPGSSMMSNIPDDLLTWLVGAAFLTCVFGMIAVITLPQQQARE